jgi:tetratricopeptide (TPR) repeat protein
MRAAIALALLLAAGPVAGQDVERETFMFIGWGDGCSVAFSHYGYPALGVAIHDEPVRALVGTLTVKPGAEETKSDWLVDWEGANTWQATEAKKAVADLVDAGYRQAGSTETIRPGADETIVSTQAFSLRSTRGWPGPDWAMSLVHYSPLDNCGLFVFLKTAEDHPFYRYVLRHLYNPGARVQRAKAHLASSQRLFDDGALADALAEAATAAEMAPDLAPARYRHAALLCLSGRLEEAETALAEAVRLDPKYKRQARKDQDFDSLSHSSRFRSITKQ